MRPRVGSRGRCPCHAIITCCGAEVARGSLRIAFEDSNCKRNPHLAARPAHRGSEGIATADRRWYDNLSCFVCLIDRFSASGRARDPPGLCPNPADRPHLMASASTTSTRRPSRAIEIEAAAAREVHATRGDFLDANAACDERRYRADVARTAGDVAADALIRRRANRRTSSRRSHPRGGRLYSSQSD